MKRLLLILLLMPIIGYCQAERAATQTATPTMGKQKTNTATATQTATYTMTATATATTTPIIVTITARAQTISIPIISLYTVVVEVNVTRTPRVGVGGVSLLPLFNGSRTKIYDKSEYTKWTILKDYGDTCAVKIENVDEQWVSDFKSVGGTILAVTRTASVK